MDRKFMQNTLESWNLNVRTENDMTKVRDHFALSDFKVVLFHLAHDVMKSLDLLGWMRIQSNGALIPLIDQGSPVTEDMCIRAGADEVISKPIVQKLFMQRVNYQIEKKKDSDALLDEIYSWGNLKLDVPQCEFRIGEKIVPLTKTELLLIPLGGLFVIVTGSVIIMRSSAESPPSGRAGAGGNAAGGQRGAGECEHFSYRAAGAKYYQHHYASPSSGLG